VTLLPALQMCIRDSGSPNGTGLLDALFRARS